MLPPDEFPGAHLADDELTCLVNTATFADMFARVSTVMSTDISRPVLNAVHLYTDKNNTLWLEACDGFRLLRSSVADVLDGFEMSVVVPASAAKIMPKLFGDNIMRISVSKTGGYIRFDTCLCNLTTVLFPDCYPDISQVFPFPTAGAVYPVKGLIDAILPHGKDDTLTIRDNGATIASNDGQAVTSTEQAVDWAVRRVSTRCRPANRPPAGAQRPAPVA